MNYPSWEERARLSGVLLRNIKANLADVDELLRRFSVVEPDAVYRFYHYSFKVFDRTQPLIEAAMQLFGRLSPEGAPVNKWLVQIVQEALAQTFEMQRTNENWLAETRPMVEAFYHCHIMLRMMARSGRELEEAP